jgi:hypothetical protein
MTKKEAVARIAILIGAAKENIREAEVLADEHGLVFDLNPARGMGGTYYGVGHEFTKQWAEEGWNPSSMSC